MARKDFAINGRALMATMTFPVCNSMNAWHSTFPLKPQKEEERMRRRVDVAAKRFFGDRKVVADICEKFVFKGRRTVDPGLLRDLPTEQLPTIPGAGGRSSHRDQVSLCAAYADGDIRYLILGLEFQRRVDRTMPVRVMEYDARQYLREIMEGQTPPLPVATLVVNLSGLWRISIARSGRF